MKKLLLIAYFYFQSEKVACNRTRGLYKYLPEYGWDVTILTISRAEKRAEIIRTSSSSNEWSVHYDNNSVMGIGKNNDNYITKQVKGSGYQFVRSKYFSIIYSLWQNILRYLTKHPMLYRLFLYIRDISNIVRSPLNKQIRWINSALTLIIRESSLTDYDVILSTSGPYSAHCIASSLTKITSIPWIADYRDLWSQNHYGITTRWEQDRTTSLEKKIVKSAKYLTTISEPLACDLMQLHGKPVEVVLNGYDSDLINLGITLRPKFTITYTGSLYKGKRDPEPLLQVLSELISEGALSLSNIEVDFYGPMDLQLAENISHYGLEECVIQHGLVSKDEAVNLQSSSQILLLLTWDHAKEIGVCPAKMYEYFAAKRPILSIGYKGKCVVSELLSETNAGVHPLIYYELKEQILTWYNEYIKKGYVSYKGINDKLETYSQRGMAKKMATVLDICIDKRDSKIYL